MKKVLYGVLVILWMTVIFLFSNQSATSSTQITNSFLAKLLFFVDIDSIDDIITYIFIPIRKLAHLMIYFTLGGLVCNFFKEFKLIYDELIVICVIFCIIYAVFDEIHQTFVPGRSGNVLDVSIDTVGSVLGIFLYTKIKKNSIKG